MSARESLDAATLRAVESTCAFRRDLHAASAEGMANENHRQRALAYEDARERFGALAAEAEARPADLADWIAAATRSKLGTPDEAGGPFRVVHDQEVAERTHYTFSWFLDRNESAPKGTRAVWVAIRADAASATCEARHMRPRMTVWLADTRFATPAELRAALDALATEAGR